MPAAGGACRAGGDAAIKAIKPSAATAPERIQKREDTMLVDQRARAMPLRPVRIADGVVAVGSGGPFAMAAARALTRHSSLAAREIAQEAMRIAADICIYTNPNITLEEL
jgi:ATP-dependent protease HslVU (ClpYQ) peptidase subunit